MLLAFPSQMAAAIASTARAAGSDLVETGGFVLGPASGTGSVLALTGQVGIDRSEQLFHIGGLALSTLFEWTDEQELSVLAQWHTHRRGAFLSKTDLDHGFNVKGFVTSVVPDFETASSDPADWGWWTYTDAGWVPQRPPVLMDASFETITFEQGNVHEH